MTRLFTSAALAGFVALGCFADVASAQQQGQQQSAIGAAAVRTREGAPSIQLDQHQTSVITVVYGQGQQQDGAQIMAVLMNPEQPQQDKELIFDRQSAQNRIVAHEAGAGQPRRLVLLARRGQENAQIEPLAQSEGVMVFGVRRAEPKVAQQPQQPDQQQQQQAEAQQAAAQQDPAQAEAQRKRAEEEAKRKAAEPKPDKYEAIVTIFLTTGR